MCDGTLSQIDRYTVCYPISLHNPLLAYEILQISGAANQTIISSCLYTLEYIFEYIQVSIHVTYLSCFSFTLFLSFCEYYKRLITAIHLRASKCVYNLMNTQLLLLCDCYLGSKYFKGFINALFDRTTRACTFEIIYKYISQIVFY